MLLLEKSYMLGGLATAGIVTYYLPLCDGMGNQVSFGIAEELFRMSVEYGAEDLYPKAWLEGGNCEEKKNDRFQVQFNPQFFALNAEKLLLESGVKLLYGAFAVSTKTDNGKIAYVIIEGKSGREAIKINRSVVDTTGDADMVYMSGEDFELFGQGNILAAWYYGFGNGRYGLNVCGVADIPDADKKRYDQVELLVNRRFKGIETEELSEMMMLSHHSSMEDIKKKRKEVSDFVPVTISTIPQVRMTRRVSGIYTMTTEDEKNTFADSVGVFSNWKKRGPSYELPFSALYGRKIKNLITAGRCISANDAMWDVTRVIPVCAVTGEAAGVGASMTDDFANIDIFLLQKRLREKGVKISKAEIF
ncbi:MAG: FAD-dependent oxidoreductase [Oscillospiraceae bacterium]|nr:FAD-dependent oxidoreductase [Oscillospiraceae bacterium]